MVRRSRALLALAAVVPAAAIALAGCGSSSSSSVSVETSAPVAAGPASTPATTAPATSAPATATAPAGGGSTVQVAADPSGALAFVQTSLTAPAGKTTFAFRNDSPVPHNFTVEKAGTETELGATKTIQGATESVTLTLPKGTYTYYCSVPGHEAAGMKGTLTVG